jgi:hypothetical protein
MGSDDEVKESNGGEQEHQARTTARGQMLNQGKDVRIRGRAVGWGGGEGWGFRGVVRL